MKKITAGDSTSRSPDLIAENIEQMKALFPEAFTEGRVDFDVLKQLLGGTVDEREEKYGLNWHGKRQARQLALTPSTGTLRPCPEDSVDWDTTKNLMIEGDNLEVLKLLQKSYAGKVRLIYIDPPYNTGKEFIYSDDYRDSIRNYLELIAQIDGNSRKLSTNTEASGRFLTDWLNMMYPRLKLAKQLLHRDGVIFVSIDDGELPALRLVANDILGEENFIASFVWKSRQNKDNRTLTGASVDHEYMVCYGNRIRGDERDSSQYANPDNDPRGDWASANMVGIATAERRPNLHFDLVNPDTGVNYGCPDMGWRYDPNTMAQLNSEGRILWPANHTGRPRRKVFLSELSSNFTGLPTVMGESVFTKHGTSDIASDFCDSLGIPRNIAELTKERIRRAAVCINKANPTFAGDVGFRVLKLDSSNIQAWDPERDNLEVTLLESIEHVKRGRSEDDILYELLLKLGLDLCVPIETRMMAGKTVRSVGAGTLIACLAERITSDEIEPLGLGIAEWHAELEPAGDTTVVFCDSAFADDVAKDDKVRSELSGAGLHHREEAATRPLQLSVDADRQGHHPVRTRSVKMAGIQGKEAGRWLTLLDGTRLWRTGGSPTTWKLTDACSSSRTSLHGSTSKPERTTSHRRQWSECTGSYANSQSQSVPSRRRCTSLYDQVGAVYCAPSRTCRACHLGVVMTGG